MFPGGEMRARVMCVLLPGSAYAGTDVCAASSGISRWEWGGIFLELGSVNFGEQGVLKAVGWEGQA